MHGTKQYMNDPYTFLEKYIIPTILFKNKNINKNLYYIF